VTYLENLIHNNHFYAVVGYDDVNKRVHLIDPAHWIAVAKITVPSRQLPGWAGNEYWVTLDEFIGAMNTLVVIGKAK